MSGKMAFIPGWWQGVKFRNPFVTLVNNISHDKFTFCPLFTCSMTMKTTMPFLSRTSAGLLLALWLVPVTGLPAADDSTFKDARAAAAKGDPKAEFFLAQCYAHGKNVPWDYSKAVEYLRLAAAQGYASAQNNLGAYYMQGLGVKADAVEGVSWFRKAAAQGDRLAEYSLGQCYFQGRGVAKDISQALEWYHQAAAQNQPDAIGALGDIYLTGTEGIKIDYEEAFKWCQKGATLENADSLNGLGFLYEQGVGGATQNPDLAVKYYREAAEKGFARAYANLGRMYELGTGLKPDPVEAYKWYQLGVRAGDRMSLRYEEAMDGDGILSEAQRQDANQRVAAYLTLQPAKTLDENKSGEATKPE
jgi:TPR repeat protein